MENSFDLSGYPFAQEVYPRIWVGCVEAAHDKIFLKKAGITTIINCSKDLPNYFEPFLLKDMDEEIKDDYFIRYFRVGCSDNGKDEEIENFVKGATDILNRLNNKILSKPILIHCSAGQQRSCAFAVCLLWYYMDYNLINAIEQVKKYRVGAFGYSGFDFGYKINFEKGINMICH